MTKAARQQLIEIENNRKNDDIKINKILNDILVPYKEVPREIYNIFIQTEVQLALRCLKVTF